ncbi:MAG: purine-nucleoside phosphorylase [Halanaerobiales bacterium]|nr:purine-nucleoside phosphorylase [Halanaerobiales bacterium]
MLAWREKRREAAAYIKEEYAQRPEIGLILGSGLGDYCEEIEDPVVIPYKRIPNFPTSTIEGHAGELVLGKRYGKQVVAMNGRVHFYEGYSMKEVVFPVWVMKELHINFMGTNPLIGPNDDELGPRFPAMTEAHPGDLVKLAEEAGERAGLHLMKGVYIAISGPVYESTAMSKFQRLIGADAVGMSTVPEIIASTHAGIKNLAISCITDIVKDNPDEALTHEEVMAVAKAVKPRFKRLMDEILKEI